MELDKQTLEKALHVLNWQESLEVSGYHSEIYELGGNKLVKLYTRLDTWARGGSKSRFGNASWELSLADFLLQNGINVPRMRGIGEIKRRFGRTEISYPFIVSDRIVGAHPLDLTSGEYEVAKEQYFDQRARIKSLGCQVRDSSLCGRNTFTIGKPRGYFFSIS